MQTFLPYPSFRLSLECLDNKRLGKQRVETRQLLDSIQQVTIRSGWQNHPAAKMWKANALSLALYGAMSSQIWIARGFKDTLLPGFLKEIPALWHACHFVHNRDGLLCPWWFGMPEFHAAHRVMLYRKDEAHYSQFKQEAGYTQAKYVWPDTHGFCLERDLGAIQRHIDDMKIEFGNLLLVPEQKAN